MSSVMDDLKAALATHGYTGSAINDMLYAKYIDDGYTGALNDMIPKVNEANGTNDFLPIGDP